MKIVNFMKLNFKNLLILYQKRQMYVEINTHNIHYLSIKLEQYVYVRISKNIFGNL